MSNRKRFQNGLQGRIAFGEKSLVPATQLLYVEWKATKERNAKKDAGLEICAREGRKREVELRGDSSCSV